MKKPDIDMQSKRMMVETQVYSDMIDALIDIVENHTVQTTSDIRRWRKAKEALQKAGCTRVHPRSADN